MSRRYPSRRPPLTPDPTPDGDPMNILTVRPAGLTALATCRTHWCQHFLNDVPADHAHSTDLEPITLALEGGAVLPPVFLQGDGPDCYDPADYGRPSVCAELVKPAGDAPHVGLAISYVEHGEVPRLTIAEAVRLRDQLDALIVQAKRNVSDD